MCYETQTIGWRIPCYWFRSHSMKTHSYISHLHISFDTECRSADGRLVLVKFSLRGLQPDTPADLEDVQGPVSIFWVSTGCCWFVWITGRVGQNGSFLLLSPECHQDVHESIPRPLSTWSHVFHVRFEQSLDDTGWTQVWSGDAVYEGGSVRSDSCNVSYAKRCYLKYELLWSELMKGRT